jgi:hypothetical protein
MLLDDHTPDSIPLTTFEKARLVELEAVVQTHLEAFLSVGRALAEIRNRRLYRHDFTTWEDYCVRRWGFGYSHVSELIRSTEIAEGLLASCPESVPPDVSPDALRPLGQLEQPELQSACWKLATRVGKPTHAVVTRVVRTVTSAIEQSNGTKPKAKVSQSERKLFWAGAHRLAESRVPSCVIIQGLDENRARRHLEVAQLLISRCHEIIEAIRREFPQL